MITLTNCVTTVNIIKWHKTSYAVLFHDVLDIVTYVPPAITVTICSAKTNHTTVPFCVTHPLGSTIFNETATI